MNKFKEKMIMNATKDLVSDLLYNGRTNDKELSRKDMEDLLDKEMAEKIVSQFKLSLFSHVHEEFDLEGISQTLTIKKNRIEIKPIQDTNQESIYIQFSDIEEVKHKGGSFLFNGYIYFKIKESKSTHFLFYNDLKDEEATSIFKLIEERINQN